MSQTDTRYTTIEKEREDLKIAGCWSHARRRFDEAVKALPKAKRKESLAYLALTMIQAVYREEKQLKELAAEERKERRQLSVRPLVEAYFTWLKENISRIPQKSKTWEGFQYCLNQERYLKVFLEDGEVPMHNNAAEQSIRGFCIGKKNWVMIDTIAGARSSAIIYSGMGGLPRYRQRERGGGGICREPSGRCLYFYHGLL